MLRILLPAPFRLFLPRDRFYPLFTDRLAGGRHEILFQTDDRKLAFSLRPLRAIAKIRVALPGVPHNLFLPQMARG